MAMQVAPGRARAGYAAAAGGAETRQAVRSGLRGGSGLFDDDQRRRERRSGRRSGSGKSTTSRIICRLIDPSEGEITFEGQSIGHIPARDFHRSPFRKDIQIVFQDPNDSLNPRFTAFDCIAHPLLRLGGMRAGDALRQRVEECAQRVGLGSNC